MNRSQQRRLTNMKTEDKQQIGFFCPKDLHEDFKSACSDYGITMSTVMIIMIRHYLED